jgi:hypothetical protein
MLSRPPYGPRVRPAGRRFLAPPIIPPQNSSRLPIIAGILCCIIIIIVVLGLALGLGLGLGLRNSGVSFKVEINLESQRLQGVI